MVKTWIATLLNFFFPGAGYLVLGHKVPMALAWLVIGLGSRRLMPGSYPNPCAAW